MVDSSIVRPELGRLWSEGANRYLTGVDRMYNISIIFKFFCFAFITNLT
jgi:hypothetical protein